MPLRMAAFLLLLLYFFIPIEASEAQQREISIGVVVPLTGSLAQVGEDIQRGMQLALETQKDTRHDYKLLFEDNQNLSAVTATAGRKLLDINKVDALVTLWSPATLVLAPLAEQHKTLLYSIQWDPSVAKKFHFTMAHQLTVHSYVQATLRLLQASQVQEITVFKANQPGFNLAADLFEQEATQYGVKKLRVETFDPAEFDFRSKIAASRLGHSGSYLLWAELPQIELMIKQIKSMDPGARLTGFFDVLVDKAIVNGSTYVSEISATSWFSDLFKKRYGSEFLLKAPNAYDILNMLIKGYETSKEKISSERIIQILLATKNYQGAVGIFSIDTFGNSTYDAHWKKVVNGSSVDVPQSRSYEW